MAYEFRYKRERKDFYEEVIQQRKALREKWQKQGLSDTEIEERISALRLVFDMETEGDYSQVTPTGPDEGTGKGKMRGYRTFRDLRILRRFIEGESGSSRDISRRFGDYGTKARLVAFKRRGKRITGENVYWETDIS